MWQQSSRIMQVNESSPHCFMIYKLIICYRLVVHSRQGVSLHPTAHPAGTTALQQPLHRDSSTHSPPEVTSSELGWGTLAGQCGEACIAAALAIPVLWRNRGLNFQGCQTAPSTLKSEGKRNYLKMPDMSEYILGCGEEPPVPTEVFGLLSHLPWSSICSKLDSLVHELMMLLPVTYVASWDMVIEN